MKPLQSNTFTMMLAPTAAATAARTASLDLSNVDYATIIVSAGAEVNTNSGNVTLTLAHGDDGTNYTTLSTTLLDNTAAAKHEFHVNAVGKKKLLKLTVTPGTHTTNDPVITCAHAISVTDRQTTSAGTVLV
jgi:hypothetical protein